MKLLYKRILIFFSVALNIGIVIMAVFLFFNHPGKSHGMSEIEGIFQKLDLTEDQHENALKFIQGFRASVQKQEKEIKVARDNMIRILCENGPLDKQRLNELYDAIVQEETDKNKLFLSHVVELRNLLGDEKGARYYSLLLQHLKNKDNLNRR